MRKMAFMLALVLLFTPAFAQSFNDIKQLNEELKVVGENDQQIHDKLIDEGNRFGRTGDKSGLDAVIKEKHAVDSSNQAFVSKVLDFMGWPEGLSEEANAAIFLVINHAGIKYQKKHFDLVKNQSQLGLIPMGDYATLVDKILVKSGMPQEYGTQTIVLNRETLLWPVVDPDKLDERRAKAGLTPIDDHFFVVESTYGNKITWDKTKTVEGIGVRFK